MKRLIVLTLLAAATITPAHAADFTKLTDVRVAMDDGVLLAADVYVPTAPDRDGDTLYPCVVELTPYRKENRAAEGSSFLPAQGIALIEVDARGTGGSAGEYDIVFSVREQQDTANWITWAAESAKKPDGSKLCETTVGTYGGSYSGIIQYLVASLPFQPGDVGYGRLPTGSPYLAAIAPQRAYGDLYRDIVYQGGQVINSFGQIWSAGTTAYYTEPPTDLPGDAAADAWFDHMTKNDPLIAHYLDRPYADAEFTSNGTSPSFTQRIYEDSSVLPRIENLRVPTLHLVGMFDAFTRGQLRTFREAQALEGDGEHGPNLLIAGPWNHGGTHFINPDQGFKQDLADWYHWWLEDAVHGGPAPSLLTGPRVRYFQTTSGLVNGMSAADGSWKTANTWPPPAAHAQRLYIAPQQSLQTVLPNVGGFCIDRCGASYTNVPTSGKAETWSRWDNAAGIPAPQQQHDQRLEVEGLTFQTEVLDEPLSVAGPINLHVWMSTTGIAGDRSLAEGWPGKLQATPPYHDTDLVVKISDVAPDGSARLVTQGYLRASHRAIDESKSEYLDGQLIAPYHPHTLASLDPPPSDERAEREYDVEIWPIAKTWAPGHKLRLDISSSDTPNHLNLLTPATNIVFYGGAPSEASYLTLPVVPS